MKTKSKIVLFVCTFALIISLFSVSCFAYVSSVEVGKTYTFSDHIMLEDYQGNPFDLDVSGQFIISINGSEFSNFTVYDYMIVISNSDFRYNYYYDDYMLKWLWEVEELDSGNVERLLTFSFDVVYIDASINYHFLDWLSGNVVLDDSGSFYDQIFSTVSDAVFGGSVLTPEQNLSLSLISTVLCIGMVLLPVLLAIGFLLRCFRL